MHTPGPIETTLYVYNEIIERIDSWLLIVNGPEYASLRQDFRTTREQIVRAAIRLSLAPKDPVIGAAPEMLAACEAALPYLSHPDVNEIPFAMPVSNVARMLSSAIASAKGE